MDRPESLLRGHRRGPRSHPLGQRQRRRAVRRAPGARHALHELPRRRPVRGDAQQRRHRRVRGVHAGAELRAQRGARRGDRACRVRGPCGRHIQPDAGPMAPPASDPPPSDPVARSLRSRRPAAPARPPAPAARARRQAPVRLRARHVAQRRRPQVLAEPLRPRPRGSARPLQGLPDGADGAPAPAVAVAARVADACPLVHAERRRDVPGGVEFIG
mmetsp:Transcript_10990/g.33992  ORF Transcript_10990/g.33992 Transcript_10990/m.33992 type:complete len:216 (+) Transcript_10990:567-1214(+)